MKKIKRKPSVIEFQMLQMEGLLNGVRMFLEEKGMMDECWLWLKKKMEEVGG